MTNFPWKEQQQCRPAAKKLDETQKTTEGRIQSCEATVAAVQSCNHRLQLRPIIHITLIGKKQKRGWKCTGGVPICESSIVASGTLLAEAFSARSSQFLAESQLEKLLPHFLILAGRLPEHLQQNTRAFQQQTKQLYKCN